MSIVRYVNKKTGQVPLYESTSYYDPETKQSRPKRKYLGIEDPMTGELIPSSGKKGRKKKNGETKSVPAVAKGGKQEEKYKEKYERLLKECEDKDARIKQLEQDNKKLRYFLQNLRNTVSGILDAR